MLNWIPVAIGGAIGATSRYYLAEIIYKLFTRSFPYGILTCNVIGSLLMGFFAIVLIEKFHLGPIWRYTIMVGFLGGFTTFSSFSLDTIQLCQQGYWQKAVVYVFLSLLLCFGAVILGMFAASKLT